jgi:dihydroxy-acid dehydratase
LVQDGDEILLDIPNRQIALLVPEAILTERRAAQNAEGWKPAQPRQRHVSPALKAYAALTTNAARCAVRDVRQLTG